MILWRCDSVLPHPYRVFSMRSNPPPDYRESKASQPQLSRIASPPGVLIKEGKRRGTLFAFPLLTTPFSALPIASSNISSACNSRTKSASHEPDVFYVSWSSHGSPSHMNSRYFIPKPPRSLYLALCLGASPTLSRDAATDFLWGIWIALRPGKPHQCLSFGQC